MIRNYWLASCSSEVGCSCRTSVKIAKYHQSFLVGFGFDSFTEKCVLPIFFSNCWVLSYFLNFPRACLMVGWLAMCTCNCWWKYRVPRITIVAVNNLGVEFSKSIFSMIISLLFRTTSPKETDTSKTLIFTGWFFISLHQNLVLEVRKCSSKWGRPWNSSDWFSYFIIEQGELVEICKTFIEKSSPQDSILSPKFWRFFDDCLHVFTKTESNKMLNYRYLIA